MQDFYFTYGSDEQYPFYGGWTRITAKSIGIAIDIFSKLHPVCNGCLNCANYYTESQFELTKMCKGGNIGFFEHEHITVEYKKDR